MKTQFLPFQTAVNRTCSAPKDRGLCCAMAIATALAMAAPLPSSPVENQVEFYETQVRSELEMYLAQFNENLVFDAGAASVYARAVWMTRYRACHPPQHFSVLSTCSFFETLFGVPMTVEPQTLECLNANKGPILHLAGVAADILAGLKNHG